MNEKVKITLVTIISFTIGEYVGWKRRGKAIFDKIEQIEKDDVFDQFYQICMNKLDDGDDEL